MTTAPESHGRYSALVARPDQIEPALVSRPGRIDQAIEFRLPDEGGCAKLTKLYARELEISEEITELIVSRVSG